MSIATAEIARPRRGRLYIVVGAILAVLAFATAAGLASLSLAQGTTTGTRVVVAKTNISARTKIQASDLQLSAFSPAPPQSFADMAVVAGKGARVDIPAGAPITANLIAGVGDLLSSSEAAYLPIPQGYVAITVPTSEQVGVGGYVQVGDRITMLATINTSIFGASPGAPMVRTVFRDLNVIRVGPVSSQSTNSVQVPSSLTMLLTACDAEFVFWLLNNATMKYTLESFKDYAAAPSQPDPTCPKPGGVGPKEVNKRWQFTGP
jgi:Flp pilus assembly protein CpaB